MPSQHIVIVGGSSGIGLSTAQRLLTNGAKVTIAGRDEARLMKAQRQLGSQANVVQMDATAVDTLPSKFAQIGLFDHLVVALGSSRGVGPFKSIDLEDVKLGFQEKVFSHFAAAQA